MNTNALRVESPRRDLLQTFRAMQSVSEAGYCVLVPENELARWKYASRWFDLEYQLDLGNGATLPVGIDHARPAVSIGDFLKTLLFPRIVLAEFRNAWSDRSISVSFMGNLTRGRAHVLKRWRSQNRLRGFRARGSADIGSVAISHSKKGRSWPEKAWDENYARTLGASKFVLCPDGDFVWTYRFFEAIAAGAIPVIENLSPHYQGFQFFRMTDSLDSLEWSIQTANDNVDRLHDVVTAPRDHLRTAIESALYH